MRKQKSEIKEEKEIYKGVIGLILGFLAIFVAGVMLFEPYASIVKGFALLLVSVGIVILNNAFLSLQKKHFLIFFEKKIR